MRVSRLLSTSVLGLLFSGSMYATVASSPKVHCQGFFISNASRDRVSIHITQEGSFSSEKQFTMATETAIEGLQVKVKTQQLFKKETIASFNMIPMQFDRKTYAVEFTVSADEEIGRKVFGCTMQPVKTVEVLTFCFEDSNTRRAQF